MKKLLSLMLALAMCASLAACGGGDDTPAAPSTPAPEVSAPEPAPEPSEPDPAPDASEPVDIVVTPYTEYDLLSQVDVYSAFSPEDLAGTVWDFSGGFTNGQELTEEDAASVLALYSGKLQVEFVDAEHANLVQGGGSMAGAYTVLEDGITLNFAFELQGQYYTYAAVFTTVSGEEGADAADAVMVLVADADPTTAFYMTPLG